VGRSVFDREALGPAAKADATLLRLGRGRPRLSLRPVNDYGGNSGQREHRSSNAFHGGDLRTAPNVAQLFAESCNGHHKKSGSRTMMSIRPETSTHSPSGAAQIRVSGLAKRYGALQVFRGIEFNVGEREIVAIVGPSGCGKRTLLRCIDLGKTLNSRRSVNPARTGSCRPAGARHPGPACARSNHPRRGDPALSP
jgi:hypothetical protein